MSAELHTFAIVDTRVVTVRASTAHEALELYRDKGADVVVAEIAEPRTSLVAEFPIGAP